MPSSTSNSRDRAPELRWGRTWGEATVLTLLALVALELFARAAGVTPSLDATPALWTYWRERIPAEGIVLLGTSKSQLAVDPVVLAEELETPVVNLAVNGASPLPFLVELGEDDSFRGTVVCGLHFTSFFARKDTWERKSQRYLSYREHRAFSDPLETHIRFALQQYLVILRPQVEPLNVLRRFWEGTTVKPFYVRMRFDRYQRADYRLAELDHVKKPGVSSPEILDESEFAVRREDLRRAIQAIRSRGGDVVFVRHLTSGAWLDWEDRTFPRDRFADPLSRSLEIRILDFSDFEGIGEITSPDGVHLDYRDSAQYTRALVEALKRELTNLP